MVENSTLSLQPLSVGDFPSVFGTKFVVCRNRDGILEDNNFLRMNGFAIADSPLVLQIQCFLNSSAKFVQAGFTKSQYWSKFLIECWTANKAAADRKWKERQDRLIESSRKIPDQLFAHEDDSKKIRVSDDWRHQEVNPDWRHLLVDAENQTNVLAQLSHEHEEVSEIMANRREEMRREIRHMALKNKKAHKSGLTGNLDASH